MDIEQLRALVAVIDLGSYSRAARSLPASRATLRLRIEALEAEIGASLLVTNSQGVEATESGAWLAERGRRLLAQVDELARGARELQGQLAGELRLLVPAGLPPNLMAAFAQLLRARLPHLTIHYAVGNDAESIARFDPDLVVYMGTPWESGAYRTMVISRIPLGLQGARSLVGPTPPRTLDELADLPILGLDLPGRDPHSLPLRSGGSFSVEPWFVSHDIHLVRCLAVQGAGLALLPKSDTVPSLPGEDLVDLLPDVVASELELRVLIPEARAESARCRAVLALMGVVRDAGIDEREDLDPPQG